ncbi:Protein argonaute MEL1 [Bienertia sinuspersici]
MKAKVLICSTVVSISPEVASKKFSREIVSKLIQDLEPYLRNKIPAYDGTKTLYTAEPLQPNLLGTHVVDIKQQRRDSCETSTIKFQQFSVTLKGGTKVETQNLQKFLDGRFSDCPTSCHPNAEYCLHAAKLPTDYVRIGRSIFKFLPESLGEGVELLRGYYQSIRPTQVGLSLNMDVSAQPFYKSIQVDDFVSEYLNLNLEELSSPLSDANCEKGIIVETEHLAYRKCYKVIGMSSEPADKLMFSYGSTGTQSIQLSVSAYFKDKYKIELKHPALPCIQTGRPDKLIYLPMQVCKIVQGQKYLKKLNKGQMDALLDKTRQEPHHRESIITEMVRTSKYSKNQIVKDLEWIYLKCVQLLMPESCLLQCGPEGEIAPSRGRWNMKGKVRIWLLSVPYGSTISAFPELHLTYAPILTKKYVLFVLILLRMPFQKWCSTSKCNESLQLLIIILPAVTGFYGKIKRICETKLGIVSQCCQPKHPKDIRDQYLANLALKINVKAGGRNTVLCDAMQKHIPPLTDDVTIIFGADVTHAQPGRTLVHQLQQYELSWFYTSIVLRTYEVIWDFAFYEPTWLLQVVASMDWPEVSKYRGAFHAQRHRVEIIENLHACVRELLIAFLDANENEKPERIIFYRDGVSEGQFAEVLSHEVDMIRQACKSIDEKYQPSITFVVVQKRHNTRFSSLMTLNEIFDQELWLTLKLAIHQSLTSIYAVMKGYRQAVSGTSRPTHYHVLCDENKFTADLLQLLTYSLCYTFARCTQSVSVGNSPAYYAHLLAFRARHYLEDMTMSEDDGGSTTVKDITKDKPAVIQSLPKIMENLKDVMFYC